MKEFLGTTNTGDRAFTSENLHDMGAENTFAGAHSFMRRKYSRDLHGVDIAITGAPFDGATSNRPGARFGPAAIRAASAQLAWRGGTWPWGFDPFETLAVIDYGDCDFEFGRPDTFTAALEAHADKILAAGVSMLTLGGDHFISYPLLRAHHNLHGPLALVHFDAHSDTWRREDGLLCHGSMFFYAAQEGLIDPTRSVHIGIRSHNEETHNFHILDADFVHEKGPSAVIAAVEEIVKDTKAYLTFDVDCLDPAYAPGTGTPAPGGLTNWQAHKILRGLGGINFVGMDLVEVSPAYDVSEITALTGSSLALQYLFLQANKRRRDMCPVD